MIFLRSFVPSMYDTPEVASKIIKEISSSNQLLYKITPYLVTITQKECSLCEDSAKTISTQIKK